MNSRTVTKKKRVTVNCLTKTHSVKIPLFMQLCQFALLFSFFTILAACSVTDEASSAEELKDYISDPDHHLCQQAEMNGYQVTVIYKPGDLLVHEEIGEEPTDPTVLEQLKKKYSNYHYFSLSISGKPEVHAAD